MVRILVIEDTQKHINDALSYSSNLIGISVDFATTLIEAIKLLENNHYDGAISDVFFPADAQSSAEKCDNALIINKKLIEKGIHHVFNTSGNHHGERYAQFVLKTPKAIHTKSIEHFLTTGMVIESYPSDSNGDMDTKQWEAAFRYILLVHEILLWPNSSKDDGMTQYLQSEGFPGGDYGGLTEKFRHTRITEFSDIFRKYNA